MSYLESLSPWKKSNTWYEYKEFFHSHAFLQYSNAYELEYSCLFIIMIYELAYSLCVMILTCSNLFLIILMNCMSRSRARVEVAVRHSFGVAYILACQSKGLESWGDIVSFLVHGRGARVHENLRI